MMHTALNFNFCQLFGPVIGWLKARTIVDNFVLVGSDDIGPVPLSEK